jgi:hypothetical protein
MPAKVGIQYSEKLQNRTNRGGYWTVRDRGR